MAWGGGVTHGYSKEWCGGGGGGMCGRAGIRHMVMLFHVVRVVLWVVRNLKVHCTYPKHELGIL